ncbi:MAG: DUF4358 domain-containing protein [Lachnospiraceae bacterium]
MKKRSMALIAALIVAVGGLVAVSATGCSQKNQSGTDTETVQNSPEPDAVYEAVKAAYGENYLPNMRLTDEEAEARYGITSDLYSSVIAEVPMISAQVDELVLIKAKDEAARDTIEEAMTAYQNVLKEDTFQYPANQLKIQASQVYVKGDYVCFIMLGVLDNETMQQADEGKVIEAYKAENEKAVAAIDALF